MGTIKWHIGMNTKLESQKPRIDLLITKEPNDHYEFHCSIWTISSLDLLNSILPVKQKKKKEKEGDNHPFFFLGILSILTHTHTRGEEKRS